VGAAGRRGFLEGGVRASRRPSAGPGARRRLRVGARRRVPGAARLARNGGRFRRRGAGKRQAAGGGAGVEVQWVKADVARLGEIGLQPGYTLLYDFGCIHGLPDDARRGAAAGLSELAAPLATLLLGAFKRGRRLLLPTGMDQEEVVALLSDSWELQEVRSVATDDMPRPVRKAEPTGYRFTRRG